MDTNKKEGGVMKTWQFITNLFQKEQQAKSNQESSAGAKPQYVDSSLVKNETWAKETFKDCQDVKVEKISFHEGPVVCVLMVYCEGLSDTKRVNETIIPSLSKCLDEIGSQFLNEDVLLSQWSISSLQKEVLLNNLEQKVFNGEMILFFDGLASAFTLNISNPPTENLRRLIRRFPYAGQETGLLKIFPQTLRWFGKDCGPILCLMNNIH